MKAQHFLAWRSRLKGEQKHIFGLLLLLAVHNRAKKEVWNLEVWKSTNVCCSFLALSGGTDERRKASFSDTQMITDTAVSGAKRAAGPTATAETDTNLEFG